MSRVLAGTIFGLSIRLVFAAAAPFILVYGTLQPVTGIAQSVFGTQRTQSAWIKLCFDAQYAQFNAETRLSKPPAASEAVKACFTYMEERDEPTGILMDIIGILTVEALQGTVLVAFLPLGEVHAPEAGDLYFPNDAPIKLLYLGRDTCDGSGCYARADLSPSRLEEIKAAKVMTMSFGNDFMGDWAGRSIRAPRACCRFAEAFAGEPVSPSTHDEMQRKIIKVLVRRFHDFIQ